MIESSLEFAYPFWFLALPLPLVVYWFSPAYRTKQQATKVSFFELISQAIGEKPQQGAQQLKANAWQKSILILSWLCLVSAMAKPTVLGEPLVRESYGRDVMVVIDLSASMAEQDFVSSDGEKLDRLTAVKHVLKEFVQSREGDRLGMILFGDAAFVQTPFTSDLDVWLALLDQTEVAMAGPSTHLGDAIGLAIKVFEHQDYSLNQDELPREKVAIVLTDGNDTGSFVEPIDAAKVAAVKGLRIHMIAMGDPLTVGEQALDMETIVRVASETGGEAFEAINRKALSEAYSRISELEPSLYETTTFRTQQTVYQYLVMFAVCINMTVFGLLTMARLIRQKLTNIRQSSLQGKTDV
ncbi:vWA domain-containing protein [Agarivorans sp. MS3-6]